MIGVRIWRVPNECGEVSLGKVGLSPAHSEYVFLHENGPIVMILRHHLISYRGSHGGIGDANVVEGAELEDAIRLSYVIIRDLVRVLHFSYHNCVWDAMLCPRRVALII